MNYFSIKLESDLILRTTLLIFLLLVVGFLLNNFLISLEFELIEIIINSISDAYLQVSVFVAAVLLIFYGFESLFGINLSRKLQNSGIYQVPVASALGALPGCGGAILVITQFTKGGISFGSVVAVLTSTMGDAAFLILAIEPTTGLLIFGIGIIVGSISGYIIDFIHGINFMQSETKIKVEFEKINKTFVSNFNFFWLFLFIPGFILGILVAFQIEFVSPSYNSLLVFVASAGAILSIFMWSLNPLSDFQCSTDKSRGLLSRVVDTTNFVTTWVISGFLVFEIFMYFTSLDLKIFFDLWLPFVPLVAILFGFLPGCGPQVVVATFYLNGYIPLSAELGNAISNDGDALFPAIALAPKAAILATLYSAIPALVVAYGYFYLFE